MEMSVGFMEVRNNKDNSMIGTEAHDVGIKWVQVYFLVHEQQDATSQEHDAMASQRESMNS